MDNKSKGFGVSMANEQSKNFRATEESLFISKADSNYSVSSRSQTDEGFDLKTNYFE